MKALETIKHLIGIQRSKDFNKLLDRMVAAGVLTEAAGGLAPVPNKLIDIGNVVFGGLEDQEGIDPMDALDALNTMVAVHHYDHQPMMRTIYTFQLFESFKERTN